MERCASYEYIRKYSLYCNIIYVKAIDPSTHRPIDARTQERRDRGCWLLAAEEKRREEELREGMDSDSDGEELCPLCCNSLDATDLNFLPCPCGYQVCLYCYERLEKDFNSRCPACRNPYGEGRYKITDPIELKKYVKKFSKELEARKALREKRRAVRERQKRFKLAEGKRQRQVLQGQQRTNGQPRTTGQNHAGLLQNQKNLTALQRQQIAELRQRKMAQQQTKRQGGPPSDHAAAGGGRRNTAHDASGGKLDGEKDEASSKLLSSMTTSERRALVDVRVIQYNLVYVIGLSPKIAHEETLRSHEYFGQYGNIVKLVVNRSHMQNGQHKSASAYITFEKKESARESIAAVNGFWLDDRTIKASFGTTKYCNMFLKGITCGNPDCSYLHHLGDKSASFTKEQMQQVRHAHFPCAYSSIHSVLLTLSITY